MHTKPQIRPSLALSQSRFHHRMVCLNLPTVSRPRRNRRPQVSSFRSVEIRGQETRTELAFADVKQNRADSLPHNDLCHMPDPCNGFPYITVAG